MLAVGVVFSLIFGIMFASSGMHWWYGLAGFWPPVGTVALVWVLKSIAERTWGVIAFTEVPDEKVAAVLLAHGRCPSCSYPLGEPDESGATVCCPECGAAWNRRAASDLLCVQHPLK